VSTDRACSLHVSATAVPHGTLLTACGILDSTTYLTLRNEIIKAALEEPPTVIVDITTLDVPTESALAVFTSARWHVERWPEVPVALVCAHLAGREAVKRNGVDRYVPVYPTLADAITALSESGDHSLRRRARADLSADVTSLRRTRELISEWLTAWSKSELIPVSKVVATTLVENVLQHTDSAPRLRVETNGVAVTVAVEDTSAAPAGMREVSPGPGVLSGLHMVAALCRTWGNSPTPSGKTVWALIGPENQL
jgi:hypothetical protein